MKKNEVRNRLYQLFRTIQFATVEELTAFQEEMVALFVPDSYYAIYFDTVIGALKRVRKIMTEGAE